MMLSGHLSDLTAEDIQRLVDEKVQESDQIEFKRNLPSKNRNGDPWQLGENKIDNYARDEILKEIIAFANSQGGWLFLGVRETDDNPSRAAELHPICKCHDLAERFRYFCRDLIEPQLPVLDVAGISTGEDDEGVVVFYVPQSRAGPHRHIKTRECYVRRADRSEKMTMREIQDLTLNLERGLAEVEKNLDKRREMFESKLKKVADRGRFSNATFGIHVTAIPLSPVYFEHVNNAEVRPSLKDLEATLNNKPVILSCPISPLDWKPILRGIQSAEAVKSDGEEIQIQIDLTKDGLVEYTFVSTKEFLSGEVMNIPSNWFICLVSNVLCSVERFRCAAGAPGVEFAMQVEIWTSKKFYISDYFGNALPILDRYGHETSRAHFPQDLTLFPNYSLGIRDKFGKVIELVEQDFSNVAGIDRQDKIQVDLFPGSTSRRGK